MLRCYDADGKRIDERTIALKAGRPRCWICGCRWYRGGRERMNDMTTGPWYGTDASGGRRGKSQDGGPVHHLARRFEGDEGADLQANAPT